VGKVAHPTNGHRQIEPSHQMLADLLNARLMARAQASVVPLLSRRCDENPVLLAPN
jgi:hypothetical protein